MSFQDFAWHKHSARNVLNILINLRRATLDPNTLFINRESQTPGDRGTESQRDFVGRRFGTLSEGTAPQVGRIASAASVMVAAQSGFFVRQFLETLNAAIIIDGHCAHRRGRIIVSTRREKR